MSGPSTKFTKIYWEEFGLIVAIMFIMKSGGSCWAIPLVRSMFPLQMASRTFWHACHCKSQLTLCWGLCVCSNLLTVIIIFVIICCKVSKILWLWQPWEFRAHWSIPHNVEHANIGYELYFKSLCTALPGFVYDYHNLWCGTAKTITFDMTTTLWCCGTADIVMSSHVHACYMHDCLHNLTTDSQSNCYAWADILTSWKLRNQKHTWKT